MFPIFHPSGKPIGFGGRIFGKEDPAKYLNSPETPLYKKSNVFYGLQATRDAIRKEGYVVLVEGYMDFLKLYQSSIYPVVSVSGTAFTSKHASSISKITKRLFCYMMEMMLVVMQLLEQDGFAKIWYGSDYCKATKWLGS